MRTRRLWTGVVLFVAACVGFSVERILYSGSQVLYEEVIQEKSAASQEIALFEQIVAKIAQATGEKRNVTVNGIYDDKKINVALVSFSKLDRARWGLPRDGMVAFPPNILLVDLNTYRSITKQAFNDGFYFAQMLGMSERGGTQEELLAEAIKLGALSLQLRIANFANDGFDYSKSGQAIATALDTFDLDSPFAIPFVFIVAHELYHLRPAGTIGLNVRQEELEADEYSIKIARQFLSKGTSGEGTILEKQLLLIGLRFFQDKLLEYSLRGLRNVSADSLMVSMYHRDCDKAETVPWPQRFNNPDVVFYAEPKGLPLLSDAELNTIRSRLDQFKSPHHEHMLTRISRMREILTEDEMLKGSAGVFELSTKLNALYLRQDLRASVGYDSANPERAGTTTIRSLTNRIRIIKRPAKAIGCDNEDCVIGAIGVGFAQITGHDGRVAWASITLPKTIDGTAAALATLDEFIGKENAIRVFLPFSASMARCGVATTFHTGNGYEISIRTINTENWFEIEVRAVNE